MSSENGIDKVAPWEEITIGTVEYAQEGPSLEHWEDDPQDAWHDSLMTAECLSFSVDGSEGFASSNPTQRYVRADIHEDIRKKKEELEASFREGMKEVEDAYHGDLVAQDKTIAALRNRVAKLEARKDSDSKATAEFVIMLQDTLGISFEVGAIAQQTHDAILALQRQLSDLTRERPMSEAPKEEGWYPVDTGENRSTAYWDDEDKQWLSAIALSPNCAYISWSYALPLPATGGTET